MVRIFASFLFALSVLFSPAALACGPDGPCPDDGCCCPDCPDGCHDDDCDGHCDDCGCPCDPDHCGPATDAMGLPE